MEIIKDVEIYTQHFQNENISEMEEHLVVAGGWGP